MRYRKKPVVVDAWQYLEIGTAPPWVVGSDSTYVAEDNQSLVIQTLEGSMIASPGDWVIKGIQGEIYPCKPDIFEATYEPVP